MMIRSYSELIRLNTFEERYEYLKLKGSVGKSTFGFDRYINQQFYRSAQWKNIRNHVIARDQGLDLAFQGYEIYDRIIIHHMNPMSVEDIEHGDDDMMMEGRKKTGTKLCARGKAAAKSKFEVYPSAYANGYAVQVCKGTKPGLDGKKHCSGSYC